MYFYLFYFIFIEHGSQSGNVGNHAALDTLRILPLSLDSFRGCPLPSGMRLRVLPSGSGMCLDGEGKHIWSRNVAIGLEAERL